METLWNRLRHLPRGLSVFLNICYRRTMTSKELDQLKKQINNIISELQTSDEYLEDVTQPIAPSVAIGRLTRMEAIGENSANPFEGGPNDVPITDLSRSIEIDIRQLIDDTDIPEPYEWKNDIVM